MPADILAGQPLRPTTPVPGLWLVDAPDTVYVRVYTAPPLVPLEGTADPITTAQIVGSLEGSQPEEEVVIEAKQESVSPTSHLQLPSLSPTKLTVPSPAKSPLTLSLPKSPTTAVSLSRSPVQALKSHPGTPKVDGASRHASPARAHGALGGVITRPPSPSNILERLRNDPLDRAWLAINALDSDVTTAALARPCAVVKPGDERRELWVFSPDDGPIAALEDLGLTGMYTSTCIG